MAQIEREQISQRQMQAIQEAKKKGICYGRLPKQYPENFLQVARLWKQESISLREGVEKLHVSHSTFSRWLTQHHFK
ncbi:resolvase/integrase [Lysinibacillus fusiformis ZC1]|nr:resolvase/integrase [Lysinibacillus fusiformis ZC1]